jgi:multicomponent K+:H+ antiporter subunit D
LIHLPILPIIIPLIAAILLLLFSAKGSRTIRSISLAASIAIVIVALCLLIQADQGITIYSLGSWVPPFGIVLVNDRLSAIMVSLTAAIALPTLLATIGQTDKKDKNFHILFQLQIAGLNGAFLTGDLFNLFVFFELLLIASYGLLAHGGEAARVKVGFNYVVLNITGSTIFLVTLGLIYGTLGTLNIADISERLSIVASSNKVTAEIAMGLLLIVFGLKSALFPLSFWLPQTYSLTSPPVAALFSIMTKVGFYTMLRLLKVLLVGSPILLDFFESWLIVMALATIFMGLSGILAAHRLALIVANLTLLSTGVLLLAVGAGTPHLISAAVFYLIHTTIVTAAFFLLGERISLERDGTEDRFGLEVSIKHSLLTKLSYGFLAIAACGAPPLSGFLGKLMLMQATSYSFIGYLTWGVLIGSGFIVMMVLSHTASTLFWESSLSNGKALTISCLPPSSTVGLVIFLIWILCLTIFAAPISNYAQATGEHLSSPIPYVHTILDPNTIFPRDPRP